MAKKKCSKDFAKSYMSRLLLVYISICTYTGGGLWNKKYVHDFLYLPAHNSITLKNLALFRPRLGPNFAIPPVPIRLRDLAKNNAVEFSIRMMQLDFERSCCGRLLLIMLWFVLVLKSWKMWRGKTYFALARW